MTPNVAIVVPAYRRFADLTESEQISWRQSTDVYQTYPFVLVCPDSLDASGYVSAVLAQPVRLERFADTYFSGTASYNKLMMSLDFFQRLAGYEYFLLCQLDVFVFRDDLPAWCAKCYSYVGPPWFAGFEPPLAEARLWAVGNGGFSLRKVADCLRVLHARQPIFSWPTLLRECFAPGLGAGLRRLPAYLRRGLQANQTHHARNDYAGQEDIFWSLICADRFAWYTVPTPTEALEFGFDYHPTLMLELNGGRLPMGFHAWDRHRNAFWTKLFKEQGYSLNNPSCGL
ncbi:hypothetical protein BEN47_17790 [Hymenobacter lapidarius]|uniref:DUF5672 domain-containing protein n=1 Tax=Hymenobacter lapidarius TaxID=1908237 RepID=A0A1G1SX52_9BACT|nr:DUF5672 family protein [Hymenobacter lapidarius]OGX83190.1 hypothetical protein BEN47_17790 [Hymenobacter lapidarius]